MSFRKSLWNIACQLTAIAYLKARCVVLSHRWEYDVNYRAVTPRGTAGTQVEQTTIITCKRCGDKRTEVEIW